MTTASVVVQACVGRDGFACVEGRLCMCGGKVVHMKGRLCICGGEVVHI